MSHQFTEAEIRTVLSGVRLVLLILGLLATYLSYTAYENKKEDLLYYLTIGFGIITTGSLVGGWLHILLEISILNALLVNSMVIALGFLPIVYALYSY